MAAGQKAVVVGISGCSSSGKTTLARLLRDIFPNTFILHEDDFYKPEEQLPIKHGLRDWDCVEAIDVGDMEKALAHIRATSTFPPEVESKEDRNSVGECPVTAEQITAEKAKVAAWLAPGQPGARVFGSMDTTEPEPESESDESRLRVCLLDGFLLYSPPALAGVMQQLDVKLFLLVSHAAATQRREARDGYVTLEGFWKDPPGYVDTIVWPNYAEAHAWLFEDGDVESGRLKVETLREAGIRAQVGKGLDVEFGTTLSWAVDTLMEELEAFVAARGREG